MIYFIFSHSFIMKKLNLFIAILVALIAWITLYLNPPFEKSTPQNFNAEQWGGFVVPNP